jgi:ketosteroid isomerase-like protein
MDDHIATLRRLYERFNARDIDGILPVLAVDVAWANGMDGGHVHGHEALRDYWMRQWSMVSPHVAPVGFSETGDGSIVAEVRQTVLNLDGTPLEGQTHGLRDKTAAHVFRMQDGKITHFDIRDIA